MTTIGVERAGSGLDLHSCPSCGRHVWSSAGRPVDRDEVLEALQVHRPAPVAGAAPEPRAGTRTDEGARRAELTRLLSTFTVHGSTS